MADWYCSSVAWSACSAWAATHAYSVGNLVRQLATPTVGNERVWRCSTAGTSLGSEPAWTLTKASTTTEAAGPVWTECTGNSAQQQVGSTSTWTAPHARLENMIAWMAAGDRGFVSSDHTQTKAASQNFTSPGVTCDFFSVNRTTGNIPPLPADITNGAAAVITGGSNNLNINSGGFWQGFTFTMGSSTDNSVAIQIGFSGTAKTYMKNCSFVLGGSGVAGTISFPAALGSSVVLDNPTFTFGNAGHLLQVNGAATIIGGSIGGATIPTVLFGGTGGANAAFLDAHGFDASALTSGTSLITGAQPANPCIYTFSNCKLASAAAVMNASARLAPDSPRVDLINCDSGATGYRNERHRFQGDMTTETTITRTGGATNGTQKVSRKVITTANASINNPFELPPIAKFNKLTGSSRTATIEIISSASLNNNDISVELEYLASSSTPISSVVSNTIATQLTAAAAQTSSSAIWDSSPATPVTQKLTVSFTPQMAGNVIARIKVAKASTTLYYDPKITIT